MIDANDLRIGNWVKDKKDGRYLIVHAIDCPFGSFVADPIPLSPELLIKCGFKGGEFIISDKGFCSKGLHFVSYTHNKTVYLAYDYDDCAYQSFNTEFNVEIKYLHQLQNLYYSLTQAELDIEL